MPLKGDVLFKSTTWLKGSHEARCAALRLWWQSFAHEVPASSLPDDDYLLAEYAGYGEVVKPWQRSSRRRCAARSSAAMAAGITRLSPNLPSKPGKAASRAARRSGSGGRSRPAVTRSVPVTATATYRLQAGV